MKKLAVIGTGIAGMGSAYFLRHDFDITFYEKNDYPGGHTHTVIIDEEGASVPVDTGFIVYNETTYPNLTQLFKELDVKSRATAMSFSVTDVPGDLFYKATGFSNLFVQKRNIFKPWFWRMLLQIERFQKDFAAILADPRWEGASLSEYVRENGYDDNFVDKFLVPMAAALWSCPREEVMRFPAVTLVRFFVNHRFLGLQGQHQWKTVAGGSRNYRDKILALFPGRVRLSCPAVRVERAADGVMVQDVSGARERFDQVVIAAHADQALAMLASPDGQERELLGAFGYQPNQAVLHSDGAVMPPLKRAWAAWNYWMDGKRPAVISYDMNILQDVSKKKDYLVSLNDNGAVDPARVHWSGVYDHPLFNAAAYRAQKSLSRLNEHGPVYFCGSYFRYGFHEDALTSAVEVAHRILGRTPEGYKRF